MAKSIKKDYVRASISCDNFENKEDTKLKNLLFSYDIRTKNIEIKLNNFLFIPNPESTYGPQPEPFFVPDSNDNLDLDNTESEPEPFFVNDVDYNYLQQRTISKDIYKINIKPSKRINNLNLDYSYSKPKPIFVNDVDCKALKQRTISKDIYKIHIKPTNNDGTIEYSKDLYYHFGHLDINNGQNYTINIYDSSDNLIHNIDEILDEDNQINPSIYNIRSNHPNQQKTYNRGNFDKTYFQSQLPRNYYLEIISDTQINELILLPCLQDDLYLNMFNINIQTFNKQSELINNLRVPKYSTWIFDYYGPGDSCGPILVILSNNNYPSIHALNKIRNLNVLGNRSLVGYSNNYYRMLYGNFKKETWDKNPPGAPVKYLYFYKNLTFRDYKENYFVSGLDNNVCLTNIISNYETDALSPKPSHTEFMLTIDEDNNIKPILVASGSSLELFDDSSTIGSFSTHSTLKYKNEYIQGEIYLPHTFKVGYQFAFCKFDSNVENDIKIAIKFNESIKSFVTRCFNYLMDNYEKKNVRGFEILYSNNHNKIYAMMKKKASINFDSFYTTYFSYILDCSKINVDCQPISRITFDKIGFD